jgi:anti-sigma B factor antagonist
MAAVGVISPVGKDMNTLFSLSSQGEFKIVTFQTSSLMNSVDLGRLGTELEQLADEANGRLILDFTKVETFASQAIGIIVSLHKKVSAIAGGQLVLCGISPQLTQLLKITRLDRLLKVLKTYNEVELNEE